MKKVIRPHVYMKMQHLYIYVCVCVAYRGGGRGGKSERESKDAGWKGSGNRPQVSKPNPNEQGFAFIKYIACEQSGDILAYPPVSVSSLRLFLAPYTRPFRQQTLQVLLVTNGGHDCVCVCVCLCATLCVCFCANYANRKHEKQILNFPREKKKNQKLNKILQKT